MEQLYGVRGWGSTLAEGALAWTGRPTSSSRSRASIRPGPRATGCSRSTRSRAMPTGSRRDGTVLDRERGDRASPRRAQPRRRPRAAARRSAAAALPQPPGLVRLGALSDLHLSRLSASAGRRTRPTSSPPMSTAFRAVALAPARGRSSATAWVLGEHALGARPLRRGVMSRLAAAPRLAGQALP